MAQLGRYFSRTAIRSRIAIAVLAVAGAVILAPTWCRAQSTIVENVGAFRVTYDNIGTSEGTIAAQQNWTAAARADVSAMLMTWTMLFGNTLSTPRPIELHLIWNDLPGNTLGSSSNQFTLSGGTWRTTAERLWRTNTNTTLPGAGYDTLINFDSGTSWTFGSGATAGGTFDFRTVVLHELGHTLGFVSAYNSTTDTWSLGGTPGLTEFDKHLRDAATGGDSPLAGSTGTPGNFNQLANPVYFDGTNANAANGGNRVAIYAPGTFEEGSSLTHLNDSTFPNSLMKHALSSGTSVRAPTAVEVAIMQDLGWTITTTRTWDKGAGTLSWTSSSNWNSDGVPATAENVAFTNTGLSSGDVINLGGSTTVAGISLDTTVDFSIGGSGTLTLGRGLLVRSGASAGTQTIAQPMQWTGVGNWQVDGAGQLLVSGAIGTSAAIYKTGLGMLALSGPNTFTGAVTVAGGVLDISNVTALGTTAAGTTVTSDASLQVESIGAIVGESLSLAGNGPSGGGGLRSTSGTNSWSGNVALAANASVGVDAGALTLSGTVSGAASLTKVGAGALVLSHANSYTLGTNVSGGTLSVSADNFLGSGPLSLSNGSTLQLTGSSAIASSKNLTAYSGGGTLNIANSAGVTLSGTTTLSAGETVTKSGAGTLTLSGPLSWGAGSTISATTTTTNLAPAASVAVSVADANSLLSIAAGASVVVNAANNDPLSDDSANRHVNVQNDSTLGGFQVAAGSVNAGAVDGAGNTTVAQNTSLTATRIRQNNLAIQGDTTHTAASVTLSRSGVVGGHPNGTPQGFDSAVSVVNSLTLANNAATIDPPPPGGYTTAERQYFGKLDLVNNDLIIKNGSPSMMTQVLDMIRAGFDTNGASGITSQEALLTGDFAGSTWLGALYNLIDGDNNLATTADQTPLLTTFDGIPLAGGEIILKYTWFGDAFFSSELGGIVDSEDAGFYNAGRVGSDVNAALNPWLYGDFDYNGIIDSNDAGLYNAGYIGGGGGAGAIHLPEPSGLSLCIAALSLVSVAVYCWPRRQES